jgi:hypothetical protein
LSKFRIIIRAKLISLGAQHTKQTVAGVKVDGDLALAYRICLWSRLANRVLLPLEKIPVVNAEQLYSGIRNINWLEHFEPSNTFVVDFAGHSETIIHTQFGAQKVKDAVVDQMREETGQRLPSIKIILIFALMFIYNDIANDLDFSESLIAEEFIKRQYCTAEKVSCRHFISFEVAELAKPFTID